MQFRFTIADKLAALTDLDVLQVQRIAFLQLLGVEEHIRRVSFEIEPHLCEDFNCMYRAVWTIELESGHVIHHRRTKSSIGAAVLGSVSQLQSKVLRRISFENTIASRFFRAMKGSIKAATIAPRFQQTARCA